MILSKRPQRPPPTEAHFFQQGYTCSNKAAAPSSAISYVLMGANYIQSIMQTHQNLAEGSAWRHNFRGTVAHSVEWHTDAMLFHMSSYPKVVFEWMHSFSIDSGSFLQGQYSSVSIRLTLSPKPHPSLFIINTHSWIKVELKEVLVST